MRLSCDALDAEVEALLDDMSPLYTDCIEAAGVSLNGHNGATYNADEPVIPTVGDAS